MAFQQGLSGLNIYAKALDVVSNNIANASTVGYKASQAQFADIYAGALYGATSKQIGIGVNLMAVQQQFTQGNISITGNALDIAINGNGFFRVQKDPNDMSGYYTRNGQFHVSKDGYIVNSNGTYLTGYASDDGVTINTASMIPLTIGTGGIPPKQTGWTSEIYADQGGLALGVNLDGRDKSAVGATDPEWTAMTPFNWSDTASPPFDASMYNYSTPATIYDQSGATHILTNYYARQGDTGVASRTWNVYTVIDNKYLVSASQTDPTATLVFNADGTLDLDSSTPSTGRVGLDLHAVIEQDGSTFDLTDIAGYDWFTQINGNAFFMDLKNTTMFGMKYDTNSIVQDGYAPGTLTNLSIAENGYITGTYSNGKTKTMGQVVLAEFKNPEGLQSIGNNMWIESYSSGQPTIGEPSAGTRGILQGGSVEDSNTDLTKELVDMIVFQRNYQANAQTIRTQDQILQTLVSLR